MFNIFKKKQKENPIMLGFLYKLNTQNPFEEDNIFHYVIPVEIKGDFVKYLYRKDRTSSSCKISTFIYAYKLV